ncbi:hypothetical protein JCM15124A_03400 [Prevotella falsenii]
MLGATLTADAQATVKAEFNKNDTTIYKDVMKMDMTLPMGQGKKKITITKNTRYVVLDKTANGYKIEYNITDIIVDGDKEVAEQAQVMGNKYLKGVKMMLQTNTDGKVEKILNLDEVAAAGSKAAIADIEEQYKKNPMLEEVVPKAKILMAISQQFEEKALIDNFNETTFFYYYGKDLKTNSKEDRIKQSMKLTSTYTVGYNGGNTVITTNMKDNMTENDVKKMMIDQMKKMGMGEEVTSQIEANWGQMKAMGMANISVNGTDNLTFLPNGWVQSISGKATTKMMGMDMKFDTQSEMTYKNWK